MTWLSAHYTDLWQLTKLVLRSIYVDEWLVGRSTSIGPLCELLAQIELDVTNCATAGTGGVGGVELLLEIALSGLPGHVIVITDDLGDDLGRVRMNEIEGELLVARVVIVDVTHLLN